MRLVAGLIEFDAMLGHAVAALEDGLEPGWSTHLFDHRVDRGDRDRWLHRPTGPGGAPRCPLRGSRRRTTRGQSITNAPDPSPVGATHDHRDHCRPGGDDVGAGDVDRSSGRALRGEESFPPVRSAPQTGRHPYIVALGADPRSVKVFISHRSSRRGARYGEAGFTVLELLVVIAVIAVLAAIATPVWLTQRVGAYDATAKTDLRNAAMQAAFRLIEGGQTPTVEELESAQSAGVTLQLVRFEPGTGYCLSAQHDASPHAWYWDSAHGGLQTEGAACASTTPGVTEDDEDPVTRGSTRHCNNGVNAGNTNQCAEFPGNGRNGTGQGNGTGNR